MLSQAQRAAILALSAKGVSKHEIAHVLRLSRLTVRKVLRSNSNKVPEIQRAEKAEPYREQILDLLTSCKGNLVRVHEELVASGAALSYPALTGFCRLFEHIVCADLGKGRKRRRYPSRCRL